MPYITSEEVAAIRKGIKRALPDYTFSIRKHHHSSIDVAILSGPIVAVEHVNVFWYRERLGPDKENRPDALEVIDKILAEVFKVKRRETEVEDSDYGTVPNFYYDVSFGRWDKPYVCTDEDAQDQLLIRQAFDQIRRFEQREQRLRLVAPA